MACGTIGPGRLSDPERIVAAALRILDGLQPSQEKDLSGERLLITVGATREEIDPVRFISNRSSGRMGFAIAEAARKRGAQVTAITGITTVRPPPGIKVIQVFSAAEMSIAVLQEIPRASIFIAAAAVADYRPAKRADQKLKKTQSSMTITLEPTPDILSEVVCNRQDGTLVIGFAAETENVLANARQKLQTKKLDAIVANDVTRGDSGFDSVSNAITIIKRNSDQPLELPLMAKTDAAHHILDEIVSLRQG
jgi:phosphopantothenoylcysteine decarboxylase/phosphopantothenate--cysteine ligase